MGVCSSCGVSNADGARFCSSCGATLAPVCPSCGAMIPEGARFCPSCGATLEVADATSAEERKLVTVLFADVAGSTGLGERLDPERLRDVMATYFAAMREEIEAEGGTVEKFIGDAVMAAFGVPTAHEDDPARALRAALRMLRRLEAVNGELTTDHGVALQIRLGVNTGEVLATTEPRPGEPMVTGDAVNVAARLQTAAEPGRILVAERTSRAVRGFRFGDERELELKGKEQAVRARRLLGAIEAPERGVPGLVAPMVGRERELDLLRSLYERVEAERRPHLITIYGDPGVGKSRLTSEFLAWAAERSPPPTVVRGRCLPYGDGITWFPLAEILKDHAGILDTDPPEDVLAKVSGACDTVLASDTAIRPERACAALAYTLGVEDPKAPMAREPRQVRAEMHAAWRGFFASLAAEGPVVVVVEDIHWADAVLLELLEELAERAEGPLLFVCPARPDLVDRRPTWGGGKRNASSIALDPLSREEADHLVTLLLAVEDLPETTHRQILERAEGNPFFLEEIVRQLIDEGRIVRSGDRWHAAQGIADVEIPDTVQGVLSARIDLLDVPAKRTLQLAAVVGRVFWPAPVGLLLNGEREQLDDILDHLEERDLVRSRVGSSVAGEQEFIFKHVLTRDVAYESLPRRDRGRAHATVADWIESTAGQGRGELTEILAYHYEEAYRSELEDPRADPERRERLRSRALETLLAAAEDDRRRYALAKAATLAERALALAASPLERALALERVGQVALDDFRGDLAWRSFREAADMRAEHTPDDTSLLAWACARAVESPMRWPGSMTEIPPEPDVRRYLDLGLASVGQEDSPTHVRLLMAAAFVPFAFSSEREITSEEYETARRDGERAADMAERLERVDLESAALDAAGSAVITRGDYGSGIPLVERRLGLADRIDDPFETGDILAVAAWGFGAIGDYPRALGYALDGIERTKVAAPGSALHCATWAALAAFHLGSWDRVVDDLLPGGLGYLGERGEEPPAFSIHLFGAAAFVFAARREDVAAARSRKVLEQAIAERTTPSSNSAFAWLAWIEAREGRPEDALLRLDGATGSATLVGRPWTDEIRSLALAEAGRWSEVPAFLQDSRRYAAECGIRALPPHLDRLEGRAALAAGDADLAASLLHRASEGFEGLQARWEKACTDLWLAETLASAGASEQAASALEPAMAVFEELRSIAERERARALLERLG